jgi:ABC-2 type transport system ATP-binding protein
LDPKQRQSLWAAFRELAEGGAALLVTTHVMDEAAQCDTLAMLQDGRIIAYGPPQQLMQQAKQSTLEQAFLHFEQQTKEAADA